jgi:eukaryotic-like serine/threonine-protein kinase
VGGGTAPFPAGGPSYAGPSQDYPDLAAQYRPGSGGGRAARTEHRGRGRLVALVVGAIVIAAAIGAGLALALGHHGSTNNNVSDASNNTAAYPVGFVAAPTVVALDHPSSVLPTGWTTYTVTPAEAGTKAGFSIDLPPGWTEQRNGYATFFYGPGNEFVDVDLTTHVHSNMVAEAKYIEQGSLPSHPGYHRWRLDREPVLGTNGAFWKYTYFNSAGVKLQANDILFIKPTPAGDQSYAIEFRTSDAAWDATVPRWEKILRTFKTDPAAQA